MGPCGAFLPTFFRPPTLLLLGLLPQQDRAEAVDVPPHHGQGHIALEALDAMVGTDVEAVVLEGIDGGFHRGVTSAQAHEARILLVFELCLRAFALLRQHGEVDDLGDALLVLGAMEALVEGSSPPR